MGKILHVKYLSLLALFLACGMSTYYFIAGESLADVADVFLATLLAAMPLSLSMTVPVALARAAKAARAMGVKLKHKRSLARLAEIDTVVMNKTGVITAGAPYVAGLFPEGVSQSVLLAQAASAERDSTSPIGQAIYRSALERGLRLAPLMTFSETPGGGVEALVNRAPLRVGTAAWLTSEGIKISAELLTKADQIELHGQTAIFVANGRSCRGIIALADEVRPATQTALRHLQRLGIQLILLTQDSKRTANAIRKISGIDDARYELDAGGKQREVQLLQARGASVAALTSNPQDALLCTGAELKILLEPVAGQSNKTAKAGDHKEASPTAGGDSSLHIEPDIILGGQLATLAELRKLTTHTATIIRQNRRLALLAYIILVPPALGLLHSLGGPFLPPAVALAGELLATLIIMLNSLRA